MVSLSDFIQIALIFFSTALATSVVGAALSRMNSWSSCCARLNWTLGAPLSGSVVGGWPASGAPGAPPRGAPRAPGAPGAPGTGAVSGDGRMSPGPGPGGWPSPGGGRGLGLGVDGEEDCAAAPATRTTLTIA